MHMLAGGTGIGDVADCHIGSCLGVMEPWLGGEPIT